MMNTIISQSSNYWTIYSPMIIVLLSFLLMMTSNTHYTQFGRFWLFWIAWIVFEFIFGKTGAEKGNIFRMMLAPMSFSFFYIVSKRGIRSEKYVIWGFVIIFLLSLLWSIQYSLRSMEEMDFLQTNYVFWPLCCAPFIFLVNHKIKWVLIGLMIFGIVISMKRSAVIIAILTLLFYFWAKGRNLKRSMSTLALLIVGYFLLSIYYSDYLLVIEDRMEMMSSDEGSGRLPIYEMVWRHISNFDIGDVIIGRGFGSITQTGFSNAHNDFLQMLYEYGIIGLVFYIALIFRSCKQLWIINKIAVNNSVLIAEGSSFIILIVMGLVSNLVVSYTFFVFLCCFWGFIEGKYISHSQIRIA